MTRTSARTVLPAICIFYAGVAFAAAQPADDDSKEIAAYTLTMEGLKKVINVNRVMLHQMLQEPKVQESLKIEAELSTLSKKDEPTEADQKRIEALQARQEQLEHDTDNPLGGDATTLAEMESRIRKYPAMQQALQREDMPAREYAKFWIAFIQASFAHGMQKSGMLKELPADVSAANVKFIAENEVEIQAMMKELQGAGRE